MHFLYYNQYVFSAVCLNAMILVQGDQLTDTVVQTNQSAQKIQETALYKLQSVTTIEGFIALLKQKDGTNLNFSEVFGSDKNGLKQYVSSAQMAVPDECSPRKVAVRLNYTDPNPKVVYYPRCTQLERCGGCVPSYHLECVPLEVEKTKINVYKAELESLDSRKLILQEKVEIEVERHLSCKLQCKLTTEKCGPNKLFLPDYCLCQCKETLRCRAPLYWDIDVCRCVCYNWDKITCCNSGHHCGLALDASTCECKLQISGQSAGKVYHDWWLTDSNTNHSEGRTGDFWSSGKNKELNMPTTTVMATTRAAAATSEALMKAAKESTTDPCTKRNCPRAFVKVHNPTTNSCLCRVRRKKSRSSLTVSNKQ